MPFRRLFSNRANALSRGDSALVVTAAVIILSLLAASLIAHPSFGQNLTYATTRQPDHLTELYFKDHRTLPKEAPAGELSTFTFHITNREGRAVAYHPHVTLVENGIPRLISQQTVTIPDNAGRDIPVSFTPANPGQMLEIIIDLPDQRQSIHFRSAS